MGTVRWQIQRTALLDSTRRGGGPKEGPRVDFSPSWSSNDSSIPPSRSGAISSDRVVKHSPAQQDTGLAHRLSPNKTDFWPFRDAAATALSSAPQNRTDANGVVCASSRRPRVKTRSRSIRKDQPKVPAPLCPIHLRMKRSPRQRNLARSPT
jgi:hypothetical protein